MRYQESYQGRRVVVTTRQTVDGRWAWDAEIAEERDRFSIAGPSDDTHRTEEEARNAARSAAAAAIDRRRVSRGKP